MTLYTLAAAPQGAHCSHFEAWEDDAIPPAAFRLRARGGGRVVAGALVAAALAAAVSWPLRGASDATNVQAAPASAATGENWIEIKKPLQLYSLQSPEFGKSPRSHEARRLASGESRIDTLTFGNAGADAAWLRLTIRRSTAPGQGEEASLFVDLARRAAEAGLAVVKSSVATQTATRFGGLDIAEVALGSGGRTLNCLGFRLADTGPGLRVAGLACPASGKSLAPGTLACVVERLALDSSGDDVALRKLFTAAELKRDRFCNGSKYVAAEGKRQF